MVWFVHWIEQKDSKITFSKTLNNTLGLDFLVRVII